MKKFKSIIFSVLVLLSCSNLFGQVINDAQLVKNGSWVYEAMYKLGMEQKITGFYEVSPITIGELKFYFNEIDYERLSESGKEIYNQLYNYLYTETNFFKNDGARFAASITCNPELYYSTNKNIKYYNNATKTFDYYLKDNLLTGSILSGFGDDFALGGDYFLGKKYFTTQDPKCWNNFPGAGQREFTFTNFTFGSYNKTFNNWGINAVMAKQGLTIGNTLMGSIFYNETFETDFYTQLNLYSKNIKYNMNVTEIDVNRYTYIHHIVAKPTKNWKVAMMEGGMLDSSFEIRFLNPLMPLHNYFPGKDYGYLNTPYVACNYSSYFGLYTEINPFKNSRLYLIYSQNELRSPNEKEPRSMCEPNSIGFQLGFEYKLNCKDSSYWDFNAETMYTSPFLYIKPAPGWSLYRSRSDRDVEGHVGFPSVYTYSWIGSPYGPDCFAVDLRIKKEKLNKWFVVADYKFIAHGVNDFDMFEQKETKTDSKGNEYTVYTYYPSVMYTEDNSTFDYAKYLAEQFLIGPVEFTNMFTLKAEYVFNPYVTIGGQICYSVIFNNNNIVGNFQHGAEFGMYTTLSFGKNKINFNKPKKAEN